MHRNLVHTRACVRVIVYGLPITGWNKALASLLFIVKSRCPEISLLSDFYCDEIPLAPVALSRQSALARVLTRVRVSARLNLIIEFRVCFVDSMWRTVIVVVSPVD